VHLTTLRTPNFNARNFLKRLRDEIFVLMPARDSTTAAARRLIFLCVPGSE
jgi:hypothetical protein